MTKLTTVLPFHQDEKKGLKWSCRPLLSCLNYIGIPQPVENDDGGITKQLCRYIMAAVLLNLNIGSCIMTLFYEPMRFRSTAEWNQTINHLNYVFCLALTHISLLLPFDSGKKFTEILSLMDANRIFSETDYRLLRKISNIGLFFCLLVSVRMF